VEIRAACQQPIEQNDSRKTIRSKTWQIPCAYVQSKNSA
jgi:hypothetical protein